MPKVTLGKITLENFDNQIISFKQHLVTGGKKNPVLTGRGGSEEQMLISSSKCKLYQKGNF